MLEVKDVNRLAVMSTKEGLWGHTTELCSHSQWCHWLWSLATKCHSPFNRGSQQIFPLFVCFLQDTHKNNIHPWVYSWYAHSNYNHTSFKRIFQKMRENYFILWTSLNLLYFNVFIEISFQRHKSNYIFTYKLIYDYVHNI